MRHIEIITCLTCGIKFEARAKNAKYCSKWCANHRDDKNSVKTTFMCPHNRYVACQKRSCDNCGWNPDVAQRRTDKILEVDGHGKE